MSDSLFAEKPAADWPEDEDGRFICSASRPMPKGYEAGVWLHEEARATATCEAGCCIRWECKNCGRVFDTNGAWEEDDSAGAGTTS